ncbi:MAG: DUF3536 domain-containing protein [Eubacteriales bacterium]|nr:DUF3536 domain-containing protein [Eubacteriales bacterium]
MKYSQTTKKYLCIHGHFYQPPRENPWTDNVLVQKSAEPYHDWNQRITRECYGPNSRSRLHGSSGRIEKLANNYGYMSFNFGPTLLRWMEKNSPWVYRQIIEADISSRKKYNGHGNAIAQVYNHIIMPLASKRDKITQIRWGISDFRHRFGRDPEGMWLAETAVDLETLKLLADEGIKFTILSPEQAKSVRPLANHSGIKKRKKEKIHEAPEEWKDVSGGRIDTKSVYRIMLDDSGKNFINVFFYNGPVSRAIAYEKLLSSGENLLARIRECFSENSNESELVNIATDGESYGHHFKFGEMALTWVLETIEKDNDIELTNYGTYLEMFPPSMEAVIFENSSWSCAHGVERWKSDCGCSVGNNEGWTQKWRTPLRQGLECLAEELWSIYEEQTGSLLTDCLRARDSYISMMLDPETGKLLLKENFLNALSKKEENKLFKLLESQRMAMFMFTSCGWFFDDISGLETIQILMYAARAIELCREWAKTDLEGLLLEHLEKAVSNKSEYENGARIYNDHVLSSKLTPECIIAHYGMSALECGITAESWLNEIVSSSEEISIDRNDIQALTGKAEIRTIYSGLKEKYVYLALKFRNRGLCCFAGPDYGTSIKDIENDLYQLTSKDTYEQCFECFKSRFPESSFFEFKDLIEDTKTQIINQTGIILHREMDSFIETNGAAIKYFTEMLQLSETGIPARLMGLLKILIIEGIRIALKNSVDSMADFSTVNKMLKLLDNWGKNFVLFSDNKSLNPVVDIFRQPDIADYIKKYLLLQIENTSGRNASIVIRNIDGLISLINDFSIESDLWEFQNMWYDFYLDKDFISSLDSADFIRFQKIGYLSGFIIEG